MKLKLKIATQLLFSIQLHKGLDRTEKNKQISIIGAMEY